MDRRSFGATVGVGLAAMCGLRKAKAEGGITVHGPELIVVKRWWPAIEKGTLITLPDGYDAVQLSGTDGRTFSLRFENVPLRGGYWPLRELITRIRSASGTVNRAHWSWRGGTERAGTLMFTDYGISNPKNGVCSAICAFTCASGRKPWPGSHRPVDFETEILRALMA